MKTTRQPDSITIDDVFAARERIEDVVTRTPLIALEGVEGILLKLETLQPIRSFKVRGAGNAIAMLTPAELAAGVYTASAGNMAQGLAWAARRHGIPCSVVVPDGAPMTKLDAVRRLGAEIVSLPYADWWNVLATHRYAPLEPARFVHPVSDVAVMAGNGTIGLEIMEDVPDVDAVLVPYGGGGLSCGIAAAMHASMPEVPIYACEVETAAPLRAALEAGHPVESPRIPTFVDGIGAPIVLAEMWPAAKRLLAGSLVVSLAEVESAIRLLAERAAVVAEGAGVASVAAGLKRLGGHRRMVCVVSGGNIDPAVLSRILGGAAAQAGGGQQA
ncbi:MAG TPA: threonine/serine dehydratase [Candidatus Dormibacteraeota bacterium]|jgi:threonine dehydratase|nr:threonine/serine dehydratase [Candidatus Dormibacteraeota bacterium]